MRKFLSVPMIPKCNAFVYTPTPPPPNKLPIQINIPYSLNNICVVIRNNNSVKLYFIVVRWLCLLHNFSYAPIFCIVFESCQFPQRWPNSPLGEFPPDWGPLV